MDGTGRRSWFHGQLSENFPKVYNYLRRLVRQPETAEDLAQEAFLKAWQALDRFDPAKPFLPWILQIARNSAWDYLRRRRELAQPAVLDLQKDTRPSPEQNLLDQEAAGRLETALQQLPEAQRSAVFLYYKEGLDLAGLAVVLKSTRGGVTSLLHRARRRLKKMLAPGA
jgi:RNA polymerase sigma-70 factor, ECF subfamily